MKSISFSNWYDTIENNPADWGGHIVLVHPTYLRHSRRQPDHVSATRRLACGTEFGLPLSVIWLSTDPP